MQRGDGAELRIVTVGLDASGIETPLTLASLILRTRYDVHIYTLYVCTLYMY